MPNSAQPLANNPAEDPGRVLYAVYDLAVSPLTFDIFPFIVAAEIARLDAGSDYLHFVLVPPANQNYYGDLGDVSVFSLEWRVRQITVPATSLIPSIRAITVCASRHEADDILSGDGVALYPEHYSTEHPIAGFSVAEVEAVVFRGDEIPSIKPTQQALKFAGAWIENFAKGRKPVSITLREAFNAEGKNSNLAEWARFIQELDQSRYFAFVVRDTDRVFEPVPEEITGVPQFPLAAVNLELRAAIYHSSYLNLIGSSGPTLLCLFDRSVRCLIFNLGVTGWHDTSEAAYNYNFGIEMGDQLFHLTPYQRLVWGADDEKTIRTHFELMSRYIEKGEAGLESDWERQFFAPNTEAADVFSERLFKGRQWGPTKKINRWLLETSPENGEIHYRLGVAEAWTNASEQALSHFEKALDFGFERPELFMARGEALVFQGQVDQALANFQLAVDMDPTNFDGLIRLGTLCEALGWLEHARHWVSQAMSLQPESAIAGKLMEIILKKLNAADSNPVN